jgi:DNA-binding PadR family transcriptional regulator
MVLLAILRLGEAAYAPAVLEEISLRTGRPASRGSIYITLDRLEEKGMIESRLEVGSGERGGRRRRQLRLTESGREALRESRAALLNLWAGFEKDLGRA